MKFKIFVSFCLILISCGTRNLEKENFFRLEKIAHNTFNAIDFDVVHKFSLYYDSKNHILVLFTWDYKEFLMNGTFFIQYYSDDSIRMPDNRRDLGFLNVPIELDIIDSSLETKSQHAVLLKKLQFPLDVSKITVGQYLDKKRSWTTNIDKSGIRVSKINRYRLGNEHLLEMDYYKNLFLGTSIYSDEIVDIFVDIDHNLKLTQINESDVTIDQLPDIKIFTDQGVYDNLGATKKSILKHNLTVSKFDYQAEYLDSIQLRIRNIFKTISPYDVIYHSGSIYVFSTNNSFLNSYLKE